MLIHIAGVNQGNASLQHVVNAEAPFAVIGALIPAVQRSTEGRLCLVTSAAGTDSWIARRPTGSDLHSYGLSKQAANRRFRHMEPSWRAQGVKAVALHPGHVATDMNGGKGKIGPCESAHGLVALMEQPLPPQLVGKFIDWRGSVLAWSTGNPSSRSRHSLLSALPRRRAGNMQATASLGSSGMSSRSPSRSSSSEQQSEWAPLEAESASALLRRHADPLALLATGKHPALVLRAQLTEASAQPEFKARSSS